MTLVDPIPLIAALNERGIPYVMDLCRDLGATDREGQELRAARFESGQHVRAHTRHGLLDIVPEGESHLVALKRLGDRTRDRADLEALEEAHGTLPELDRQA